MTLIDRRLVLLSGAALLAKTSIPSANATSLSDTTSTDTTALEKLSHVDWITTSASASAPWVVRSDAKIHSLPVVGHDSDILLRLKNRYQQIKGFGACFSELSWKALSHLSKTQRTAVLDELFNPETGANLTLCRTPIGASDFAENWYSYDETSGDFDLTHFSIDRDRQSIIPFIQEARKRNPELRLWASPWSPPSWMKYSGHYATSPSLPGKPANNLKPEQVGTEGKDSFIQKPRYLSTYATYFEKYILAYREAGIPIFAVMPQNEFNSTAPYPSCCWTAEGLARLITHLYPKLEPLGVKIYFGTLERPDPDIAERFLHHLHTPNMIEGFGVQWAGKGAIAALHDKHPELDFFQSEAECGDGKNDWRYCRYIWRLMLHFFINGITVYDYWNIALESDANSAWGWKQNSLVSVDAKTGALTYNHEFYLLKHFSHYVMPGAIRFEAISWSGYDNVLAFLNPDGRTVIIMQNDTSSLMPIRIRLSDQKILVADLPPDSFNTFVLS